MGDRIAERGAAYVDPTRIASLLEAGPRRPGPILVIGDLICDHYVWGDVERVSPEAPVQVLRREREADRPGGAANVALNLAALDCRVCLAGVVGADAAGRWLLGELRARGVCTAGIIEAADRATSVKTRVIARGQQLLRIDREIVEPIARERERALISAVHRLSRTASCIICSDYGKGVLSAKVLATVRSGRLAGSHRPRHRPLVLVDPKGRDFARYRGADILTPNEKELLDATSHLDVVDEASGLDKRAEWVARQTGIRALLVTRGANGMDLFQFEPDRKAGLETRPASSSRRRPDLPPPREAPADRRSLGGGQVRWSGRLFRHTHIPVLQTHEVYDVTGAGDTVAAVMGLAVSAGISLGDAARLANTAAGLVVGAVGTAAVEREVLAQLVDGGSSGARSRILSAEVLRARLEDARARGAKVVLTTGCFDLLHVGHLHLLQRARALGDLLVVAIHDDASARALKGPGRPLVPEAQRAETLAALRFVDYVTVFSDRTPIRLMRAIRPDTLVTGADDAADRIAGRAFVESYGGRVELVGRVPARSTSKLLATIRKRRIM